VGCLGLLQAENPGVGGEACLCETKAVLLIEGAAVV
jgi:hypothetical protein